MSKVAIISGVTGQDGSYLAESLLKKDYIVIGTIRYTSNDTQSKLKNIQHIINNDKLILEYCDITDFSAVNSIILKYKPSEVYNLAAQSHVGVSYKKTISIQNINIVIPLNI